MERITDEQFIRGMELALEERGEDFVYEDSCAYRVGHYRPDLRAPGCLVGLAVYLVSPEAWDEMNEGEAAEILPELGVSRTIAAAAGRAQYRQDDGEAWGDAMRAFRETLDFEDEETAHRVRKIFNERARRVSPVTFNAEIERYTFDNYGPEVYE